MEPDKFGHCALCHKNLITPRVVGGKQIIMFTPEFDQTEFVISNNSRMVVCMCKSCKNSVDLSHSHIHNKVMESVKSGWDGEIGDNKRGPREYHDLNILFHSEGIDDYVVHNRLKEIKNGTS